MPGGRKLPGVPGRAVLSEPPKPQCALVTAEDGKLGMCINMPLGHHQFIAEMVRMVQDSLGNLELNSLDKLIDRDQYGVRQLGKTSKWFSWLTCEPESWTSSVLLSTDAGGRCQSYLPSGRVGGEYLRCTTPFVLIRFPVVPCWVATPLHRGAWVWLVSTVRPSGTTPFSALGFLMSANERSG